MVQKGGLGVYILYKFMKVIIIRTKINLGREEWNILLELVYDMVYLSSNKRTTKVTPPNNTDSNQLGSNKEPNKI